MDKEFFLSAAGIPPPLHSQTASFSSWRPVSSTPMETQPHPHHNSWEKSTGQFPHFDSSLSSVAPSPAATTSVGVAGGDGSVIRELIGRMGSICSSGEVAPSQPLFVAASSTMALNPAPKLMNLPAMMNHFEEERLPSLGNPIPGNHAIEFPGDPGFAERAAKFSSFGSGSFNGRTAQMGVKKSESLLRSNPLIHRASSTPSLEMSGSQMGIHETKKFSRLSNGSSPRSHAELGNSQEESSVSEQIPTGEKENLGLKGSSNDLNSRKRKAVSCRGSKGKELLSSTPSTKAHKIVEDEHSNAAKRCKLAEGNGNGNENGNVKAEEDPKISSPKLSEPPKDYIHVRARRGQATDSHSLAERVRREKISERMKLLQDLVPGCNKVTAKALMLDEIINYVQSLQRQVEFLSMKLASADFKPDFNNSDNALQKDNMFRTSTSMPHPIYDHPLDSSAAAFYGQQSQRGNPLKGNNIPCGSVDPILEKALIGNHSMELPQLNGFVDESLPQLPAIAHDDLQSIVQMGFGHNPHQEPAFLSQNFHGTE